jgi:hypothetical protein
MSFYKRVRLLHRMYVESPLELKLRREYELGRLRISRDASVGPGARAWIVHIVLMPVSYLPFTRDTAARKHCISCGIQQILVVPDTDSLSFTTSVDIAFYEILRGRAWQPLIARLLDAKNIGGPPTLRPLPEYLVGSDYNVEFLKHHCAVLDENGKILDIYISSCRIKHLGELKKIQPFKP